MRNNHYESAVIINASLEDQQIDAIVAKLKDAIVQNGCTLVNVDLWGRKRLAYTIKKCKVGYYVIFRFEGPVAAIAQIERIYRLDESILRFLTIKLSKLALESIFDQEQKAAAAKLAEAEAEKAAEAAQPAAETASTPEVAN
ncbi:MAG: 30S ribosomal protein S6 [Ignavibacteria bacterium]|nr:30S ribosomal protein S6 [Ignavibacteria bacterium]